MTCEAGKQGEGTAAAVPDPGSVTDAAISALAEFGKAERIVGSVIAHATFDGILSEHALALEEARDLLRDDPACGTRASRQALVIIDDQITYVRALGSVAQKEETDAG